jgi:hypothetical protein
MKSRLLTANTVLRSYAIKGSPHRRLLLEEIYYALGMSTFLNLRCPLLNL